VDRIGALDGLRGLAAVVVVICHSLLIVPAFAASIVGGQEPAPGTPEWFLLRTPLRMLTMGAEAVMLFFVLSGFVLTLGFIGRRMTPRFVGGYLARRVVRLYIPVWGSLLLALLLATLIVRDTGAASPWLAAHHDPALGSVARDAILLLGTSNLNSPLWSLTWEVWFSLLLPVLWIGMRALRVERWWIAAVPVLIALSCLAEIPEVVDLLPVPFITGGLLKYLPVFCLGMILALKVGDLRAWFDRSGRAGRAILVVTVMVLLLIPALFEPFSETPPLIRGPFWVLSLLGAAGLVVLAIVSRSAGEFLTHRVVMFFGRRSFSLYLVHEPIIVASALLLGAAGWWPWLLVLPVVYGVIVLVTMAFYRFVEKPSIAASRAVGRAFRTRTPAAEVTAAP
jgi:peptidoglycan/LPS O-acetylase OafA/YrhL